MNMKSSEGSKKFSRLLRRKTDSKPSTREAILLKIHHVGIACVNLQEAIQHHCALFNLKPVSQIEKDPIQKVFGVLLANSDQDVLIELISPTCENSPVSDFLRRGIHLYHVCYLVDDIELALINARNERSIIVSRPAPAKLFNERRIAFVYTRDGYMVEFLEERSKTSEPEKTRV